MAKGERPFNPPHAALVSPNQAMLRTVHGTVSVRPDV